MSLERTRSEFYQKNIKKYNTSKLQLIKILKINNFESFKESELKEYQFAIDAYFNAQKKSQRERTDEAIEAQKESHRKVWGVKEYYPCPVEGCTGKKITYDGVGYWKCTAGGGTHYHAYMVARMWKAQHPDSEITIGEKAAEFVKTLEVKNAEKTEV
ncbi:MAG: hypothetical protein ACP5D6_09040 [Kosmotogaceae bacterium]